MGAVAEARLDGLIGQVTFQIWIAPPPRHAIWISTSRYTHCAAGYRYASGSTSGVRTRDDTLVHPPFAGTTQPGQLTN